MRGARSHGTIGPGEARVTQRGRDARATQRGRDAPQAAASDPKGHGVCGDGRGGGPGPWSGGYLFAFP